jgi:tetratricopeptide (TPR) repeat protein
VLWYIAARAAYRELDHALAIDTVERALKALKVPLDRLPATTDPKVIDNAIEKINPDLSDDYNMSEIPYLLEASREIVSYRASLKALAGERPEEFGRRSRRLIIKYSNMVDDQAHQDGQQRPKTNELAHRDLRQALYLIDATLAAVPKTADYSKLREWLHYRKVRVSVAFAAERVGAAVAGMEQEFPASDLLDDVLAEQIFAQGLVQRDVAGAQATFRKLIEKFPRGNAVDNAHTWMAIIYRCEGRIQDAQNMNRDIIRKFPNSRHAVHAQKRITEPDRCGMEN